MLHTMAVLHVKPIVGRQHGGHFCHEAVQGIWCRFHHHGIQGGFSVAPLPFLHKFLHRVAAAVEPVPQPRSPVQASGRVRAEGGASLDGEERGAEEEHPGEEPRDHSRARAAPAPRCLLLLRLRLWCFAGLHRVVAGCRGRRDVHPHCRPLNNSLALDEAAGGRLAAAHELAKPRLGPG
uniref:Uncharacterized protein n=1 Tax=Arundo donax TaxID=35708 RepID=A0A0A8XUT9_ARUDO